MKRSPTHYGRIDANMTEPDLPVSRRRHIIRLALFVGFLLALFVLVVALERLAMPWRQPAARRVDW